MSLIQYATYLNYILLKVILLFCVYFTSGGLVSYKAINENCALILSVLVEDEEILLVGNGGTSFSAN